MPAPFLLQQRNPRFFAPFERRAPQLASAPVILPNGDFLSGSTPPTLGSGVSVSGGIANCSSAGQIVTWSGVLAIGRSYRVTLDYSCTSGTNLRANNSATNGASIKDVVPVLSDGLPHTISFLIFAATSADLSIEADLGAFSGWIDNVVAVEAVAPILQDGDFLGYASEPTVGSGVTVSGGVANCTAASQIATWTGALTVGQSYSISLDYNCSAGSKLRINNSATNGAAIVDVQSITVDGTRHTVTFATFTATSADFSIEADTAVFSGWIDNAVATVPAGAGSITATASPSPASFTTTSTAKVLVKAAAAPALASFSLSSVAAVKVKASASPALNTFLSAAAAKALVHGLGSGTLNAFTSTAVAKVKVKASASPSLANLISSATGAVKVKAAASITPNAFTSAAADRILVKGAGSGILSAFGTTSTARVKVKAAAAPTLGLFTTTAVADVISANINAAASITLSPFVSAAAAKALVEGIGSGTLNQFTASATAKAKVRADASLVLDAFTGTAQAAVRIKAAATISCGPFTLTARLASLSDYPAGPFSDERVAIVGRGSRQAAVANDSGLRIAKVARRA